MTTPINTRKLTRSTNDKWIAGVCGGIAQYFGWNANIVRLLFVISCLLPGPQFILYLVLWLVIPKQKY
ncbi:PspC domain-containing protein [Nocardia huaxiensis]|uniref:PspC domain-containing protein n=1 Tax=Nocardia huaxiensis TaxID=2755382 RepID=A0A7D6VAS5_9NOCA|nr:PspC domain-containing protein [Nocardia huaxiensis]QLY31921.1 PspC domain-containing protein [Nocardia huaxiensis]UFS95488.1 PspC domain-containing protein [Nocardia huaxiensis]